MDLRETREGEETARRDKDRSKEMTREGAMRRRATSTERNRTTQEIHKEDYGKGALESD